MTQKEELAALKARVDEQRARIDELERAAKPPAPFVPKPHQQYDPTAGMSMPRSTMLEMAAAVPDRMMREIALRDARAPTGPSAQGAIPSSQQMSNVRGANVAGSGTGWAREIPLGPSMHQRYVDAQLDAQDAKDRHELIERDAKLKAMKR